MRNEVNIVGFNGLSGKSQLSKCIGRSGGWAIVQYKTILILWIYYYVWDLF